MAEAFTSSWTKLFGSGAVSQEKPTSVAFSDSPVSAKVSFQGWEYMNGMVFRRQE